MSRLAKYFYFVSVSLQIVAQFLTFDRAGMIGTTVGLLIFLSFYYKNKFIYVLPLIGLIILYGYKFSQVKGYGSFISRYYLLIPAFEMIFRSRDRLLWGYGLTDGLIEYRKNVLVYDISEYLIRDPHNSYVTLVMMFGLVFTIFLISLIGILFFKCLKRIIDSKNNRVSLYYLFLLSSLLAILIQSLFDAEIIQVQYYVMHYLFILLGLMYISIKKNDVVRNFVGYIGK